MAKANAPDESDCIQLIAENFQQRAQAFAQVTKLRSTHGGVSGSSRETIWAELLREVLPQKFSLVQNVVLIDSQGQHSCEIDVAAIDEQYTPYVFRCGEVKFVPIEAVALVMECKSTGSNNKYLKNWQASIAKLTPSPYGIARMATGYAIGVTSTTQKATRPLRVFAAFHSKGDDLHDTFDIFLRADENGLKVTIPHEDKPLAWWAHRLNNAGVAKETPIRLKSSDMSWAATPLQWKDTESADTKECTSTLAELKIEGNHLLSLNLQLNQLLMLINNPMLFPHFAYAKVFRDRLKP